MMLNNRKCLTLIEFLLLSLFKQQFSLSGENSIKKSGLENFQWTIVMPIKYENHLIHILKKSLRSKSYHEQKT